MSTFDQESRIFITGHRGLVGSAIQRRCELQGFRNIVVRARAQLDLRDPAAVNAFFAEERPQYVFHAAGVVGGIHANDTMPVEFIRDNLQMAINVIDAAWRNEVRKLLFLGSSCIYPKHAPQPLREEYLLSGPLEPTNQWYAMAKLAGLKLCQAYRRQYGFNAISLLPTNLYGPGDNFDLETAHVLPALIRKMHEAKVENRPEVVIWGKGIARREFLYVDDCADALVHLMKLYSEHEHINVGCGTDLSVLELAHLVKRVVGFEGAFIQDLSKPDGTPRKLLNVEKLRSLGWHPAFALEDGVRATYRWFLHSQYRNKTISSEGS